MSSPPEPEAHAALLRITGLPLARFRELYWRGRPAYDEGKLTGLSFWRNLLCEAGQAPDRDKAMELSHWDARMWTTENAAMLAWQEQLKQRGLLTAILSNMGDNVYESIERELAWIHRFDVQVWSYRLGIVKPDAAIYLYTLEKLGTRPEETLFLDDKLENIEAARELGIQAIQFSTVERLREELIARGLDEELPLPA